MNLPVALLVIAMVLIPAGCDKKPKATPEVPATVEGATAVPSASSSVVELQDAGTTSDSDAKQLEVAAAPRTIDELLLFFPIKYPEGDWEPKKLRHEDAWFESADGTQLHAWYCPAAQPRAYVLYAHGNAGHIAHRSAVLAYLQAMRISTFAFDYRGYGRSEGLPTKDGIVADAKAARTHLAKLAGVEESDIVLMGRSLGGAVVAQLAADLPPKGLVIESSFSSLSDIAKHHYPALAWLVNAKKLDSVAALSAYKGPLLQSHGDADRTIPFALARKLFDAANQPKHFVTIRGGGHNSPQSVEYYRELARFLDSL